MEAEVTNVNNSFLSNCEFKEEVSEVDTDILSYEKEISTSEEESSNQLCSSGQRRNVRSFQRHPSVDEWLLGLAINTNPVKEHKKEVEDVTHTIDEDIQIDKRNGMELHKDEAFFQAYVVKERKSEISVYDSSEKDDIQDRNEIAESLCTTISSSQYNKEEDDDEEDDEEDNDEEEKSDHMNNLLELEIKALLNILISLSDESPDTGEVFESNIEPNNFEQVNDETFEESVMESCQIRNQENTHGNLVSDLESGLQLICLNYEEKPQMENPKPLCVSNYLVEKQHKHVNPSFFTSCEQESEAEHIIDLKISPIRESREMCVLPNISETRISLEESDAYNYMNETENKNVQESIFENVDSTECTETQLSNEDLENTTDLLHENNQSALPLTLTSFENIASNDKILKTVESPRVFSDIAIEKSVYRRSKSLKTCRTPPGNPSCPKLVRFADILGLDLSETRVFADEIPKVPKAAFLDLAVEHIDNYLASNKVNLLPKTLIPRPEQLVPIFPQPGSLVQFHDLVRCQKICLESARMTGLTTLTGDVRVLNISFNKNIFVLWTVDNWATRMETVCEYVPGTSDGITDKFRFHLETAGLAEGSRVHLCIRYETGEQQFWDNNGAKNYVFRVVQP